MSANNNNSVIDTYNVATKYYTPKRLYIKNFVLGGEKFLYNDCKEMKKKLKIKAFQSWDQMTIGKEVWETRRTEKLVIQPYIKDMILQHFSDNLALTFE